MTLLERLRLVRDSRSGYPEWVRRALDGRLPAKDTTTLVVRRVVA